MKSVGLCFALGAWTPLIILAMNHREIARQRNPAMVVGSVERTDCPSHADVWVAYAYAGVQRETVDSSVDCPRLMPGASIKVHLDRTDPTNASIEEPTATFWDSVIAGLLLAPISGAILWFAAWRWQRRWATGI